ncbi:MAG: hypothetical protein RMY29_028000 [Nostoc sp. CreGUA01]|nr:hypothetical protein [Nostoc sp. CreGUA01]
MGHWAWGIGQARSVGGVGGLGGWGRNLSPHTPHTPSSPSSPHAPCPVPHALYPITKLPDIEYRLSMIWNPS